MPLMIPSLTADELEYLLAGGKPTNQIIQKAVEFSRARAKKGMPYFATENEQGKTLMPGY